MITLSLLAKEKISSLLKEKHLPPTAGLRLSLEKGGCAGVQYVIELREPAPGDLHYQDGEISLFIDPSSVKHLEGSSIDYQETLSDEGFKITNPNVIRSCGCGTSFEPKQEN